MTDMERAVAHGYLRTRVQGYWEKRERLLARQRGETPTRTGPNVSGWQKLAAMFERSGRLQQGGERLVAT